VPRRVVLFNDDALIAAQVCLIALQLFILVLPLSLRFTFFLSVHQSPRAPALHSRRDHHAAPVCYVLRRAGSSPRRQPVWDAVAGLGRVACAAATASVQAQQVCGAPGHTCCLCARSALQSIERQHAPNTGTPHLAAQYWSFAARWLYAHDLGACVGCLSTMCNMARAVPDSKSFCTELKSKFLKPLRFVLALLPSSCGAHAFGIAPVCPQPLH